MKYVYLLLFSIFSVLCTGQNSVFEFDQGDTLATPYTHNDIERDLQFGLEMGTTFGVIQGYGNYFGTYVSPRLQYPLSNRFTISGGMMLTAVSGGPVYSAFDNTFQNGRYTSTLLFAEGAYQVNENLTLTGATFHEVNFGPPHMKTRDEFYYESDYKGIIMGVDYKLGENVFIRGQIEFSNGRNPYRFNPAMSRGYPSFLNPHFD